MTERSQALAEADPLVVRLGADQTDGAVARFESLLHPRYDGDAPGSGGDRLPAGADRSHDERDDTDLSHRRWRIDSGVEHVHLVQSERWEVLSGELRVELDGRTRTLTEGEEITIPEDEPHRHWNPTDEPVRVLWERRPALRTEAWAETTYALAQAGEADPGGLAGLLQSAVVLDTFPEETPYATDSPVVFQRLGATLLAPIARLAGYEGVREREDR